MYEGDWKDGSYHGRGRLAWAKGGAVYEGDWKDNECDGCGKITFANGAVQQGAFKNNVLLCIMG